MGLNWWLKTRSNGDNQHKNNGLNTDQNMVNSSKHKTTAFEIQARDKHTVAPSPQPPTQRASSMAILVQGCPVHQEQQINAISCIYSCPKKGLLQLTLGNPLLLHWNIQSWNCNHFQKCWEGSYFSLFFILFSHQHLSTCACHADHVMIL